MSKKYFWPIIIFASIAISILVQSGLDTFNIWHISGRATGIFIFPALATLIIAGITKLFQKTLSKMELKKMFVILWAAGLLFLLVPFFSS